MNKNIWSNAIMKKVCDADFETTMNSVGVVRTHRSLITASDMELWHLYSNTVERDWAIMEEQRRESRKK